MTNIRKERLDRGIKVRCDDIFLISSYRELAYALLPRILFIVAMLVIPLLIFYNRGLINIFVLMCVVMLLSSSWYFMAQLGLPSLGHAFFFGVGSYCAGYFSHTYGWTPLYTIPLATILSSVFCALILSPILRLKGIYFGLVTFILPILCAKFIEASSILGGTDGLTKLAPFSNALIEIYIISIAVLIYCFFIRWLIDTDYGMVLTSIKDNDRAVIASGINIDWFKTQAIFLACLPAAFGGVILTHHYQVVGVPVFTLEFSLLPLAATIVGGITSIFGAITGSCILVIVSELLRGMATLRTVIYSIVLVVCAIGLPEGIFHYLQRKYFQFEHKVAIDLEGGR